MVELSGRQKALLSRGYSIDEIINLSNFTKEELDYAINAGLSRITRKAEKVSNPSATFVGGQPGSGKSSVTIRLQKEMGNAVEVNLDNYRSYHPNYLAIEECIKRHWENRTLCEEDTPGNDLADFTHQFVSDISDAIIEGVSTKDENGLGYNIIIEWGMRNPEVPLQTMESLKNSGYRVSVEFVCIHKSISMEACIIRASVMDDHEHIIRNVPTSFHELCINALPDSINQIYERGFESSIIDSMKLCLRDGTIVWDDTDKTRLPGDVFKIYLEDYELTKQFRNSSDIARIANRREVDGISVIDELIRLREQVVDLSNENTKRKGR